MTDLSLTIAPKSDQLNSDDLIAGPITISVTRVVKSDSADQPIKIFYDGDNGKPYLPCKSMRRVLVQIWGKDGSAYVGKRMTLYRDPLVKFGGDAVGGIRISHMDGIEQPVTLSLTATRGSRKPYTVQVLREAAKETGKQRAAKPIAERVALFRETQKNKETAAEVETLWRHSATKSLLAEVDPETREQIELEYNARLDDIKAQADFAKEERS